MARNLDDTLQAFLEKNLELSLVKPVDPDTLKEDSKGSIKLPGSGSARAYMKWLDMECHQMQTKLVCLVMYCSEGDNRQHAFKFADKVANLLNRNEKNLFKFNSEVKKMNENELFQSEYQWNIPFSWQTVFGDEPPSEIY